MTRPAKRVCFFNTTRFWGGGEQWNLETATRLRAKGHDVRLIAFPDSPLSERAKLQGFAVTELAVSRLSGLNPFMHAAIRRVFTRWCPETVVFNGPDELKAGGLAARSAGVAQRVYQRGLAVPVRNRWLNRYLFTRVLTHIVANSEATKSSILQNLGVVLPHTKVQVIYLGVDLLRFAKPGIPCSVPVPEVILGNVGRLAAEKNQHALLEVAVRLKDANLPFKIRIAGAGTLEAQLRSDAVRLGVADHVTVLGFVDDVAAFLSEIDIFLLTSKWEGFGLALVEAGAAGKPAVAFSTTSTPEVVDDGVSGFLVTEGDLGAFTERVIQLIRDSGLRRKMGRAAYRHVEHRFQADDSIEQLEQHLWGC